jgi:hypothetical protein
MTEEEFKDNYVKSFLEAYKTAVTFYSRPDQYTVEDLLKMAKDKAELAWRRYKDTAV